MDQPSLPSFPFATPPPPKSSTLPWPAIVICGLVVLFAAGVVGRSVVIKLAGKRPAVKYSREAVLVQELANGQITPYELLRKGNEQGGRSFRRGLARAAERATRRTAPGSTVTFDEEIAIEDLVSTMRGRVSYRGQARSGPNDFEGVRVEGEQRQYFHPEGLVIVDVVCVKSLPGCDRRDLLLDATEGRVLDNLAQSSLDELLPESGKCEVTRDLVAGALASCEFGDEGVVLSLQRLSLNETRLAMRGLANTPAPAGR